MGDPEHSRVPYGKFSHQLMQEAVLMVLDGTSIRKAAAQKGLAFKTVARYVNKYKNDKEALLAPNYAVNKIFTSEEEQALVDYIINCSKMFYGLTTHDCRKLAYEMAIVNKKKIPDSWHLKNIAGQKWMSEFKKRNPSLTLRTPEACSLSRATSFNRTNVKIFFDNLKKIYARSSTHFLNGTRIYNLDETSTMTVQKPHKILAQKGLKQVSKATSAERGTLVTTCCIIQASGHYLPPVMIFPRVKCQPHMLHGAPAGTLGLAAKSGWMNSELMVETMHHFIKYSSCTKDNPALLIFDNHESHLSVKTLNLAKDNGVIIITVPPHSTNKMQPLDVCCLKPFKIAYNSYIDSWLMRNPGQTFTIYNVAAAVGYAHEKGFIPSTIISSFKKTGIFPYDENIFTDIDFLPSVVTDRDIPLSDKENIEPENIADDPSAITDHDIPLTETENIEIEIITDQQNIQNINEETKHKSLKKQKFISPEVFKKYPKALPRKNKVLRRKRKSIIATDTPEKNKIEEREKAKNNKAIKKQLPTKVKKVKKVIEFVSSDEEDSEEIELQDTDDDNDMEIDTFSELKDDLEKQPEVLDYVLVEFKCPGQKKIYYVGRIFAVENGEFSVRFFRRIANTNRFIEPNVEDIATISSRDIKMILPEPVLNGHTSRQLSSITFPISFNSINLR